MSKSNFVIEDVDWSLSLERDYEEYIARCEEMVDYDVDDERWGDPDTDTLSGEPFCGCSTCYTREQLFFLVPRIIEAYKQGKITIEE